MAEKKLKAAGGKWNTAASWEPEVVPLETDDVVLDATSGNCEVATNSCKCRSLDALAYTKTLSFTTGSLKIGASTASERTGMTNTALKLNAAGSMTLTPGTGVISMVTTNATAQKVFANGNTLPTVLINSTGKWVLEEALSCGTLEVTKGELNTNGFLVTVSEVCSSLGAAARTLTLGASVVKLTGASSAWNLESGGLTLSAASATIEFTGTGVTQKPFTGVGGTYGTLTATADSVVIKGSNTFTTLNVNSKRAKKEVKATLLGSTLTKTEGETMEVGMELKGTALPTGTVIKEVTSPTVYVMSQSATETVGVAETIEVFNAGLVFEGGTTQTVTSLTGNGSASELNRIGAAVLAAAEGAVWKIKKASGTISLENVIIRKSKAETATEWYAGAAPSRDAGENTTWKFEAPPSGGLVNPAVMMV